jgi:ABC-2 type transport system permease protein
MVIARHGILTILRKRLFVGLLLLALIRFLYYAVRIYISANYPQMAIVSMTAESFCDFLDGQGFFVFVITVWVGAGLIANDKRANALQIYLSKPLTRTEYIAGKAVVLTAFLLLVTWLPAVLLLALQVAFSGSLTFLRQNLYLFPAVTVFALLQVFVSAFLMLALSSMSKSSRFVAVLYAGAYYFSQAMYGVTYLMTRSSRFAWISLPDNLTQVGFLAFRLHQKYSPPPLVSVGVLFGLILLSLIILERRVRGVEVVQ